MRTLIIVLIGFFLSSLSFGQLATEWTQYKDAEAHHPLFKIDSEENIIFTAGSFISKFDSTGNELWSTDLLNDEAVTHSNFHDNLAIDENDNIYIIFNQIDTLFEPSSSQDSVEISVIARKYSPEGVELWSRQYTDYTHYLSIQEMGVSIMYYEDRVYITGIIDSATDD